MRHSSKFVFLSLIVLASTFLLFQNCSDQYFEMGSANGSSSSGGDGTGGDGNGNGGNGDGTDPMNPPDLPESHEPDLPDGTKIMDVKDMICGGARFHGKYLDVSPNQCTIPVSNDRTCDRWGCAIQINANGDTGCPEGTQKKITDTTPTEYFICVKKVGVNIPTPKLCGWTRTAGKWYDPSECNDPVTNDNTCNFFNIRPGCVVQKENPDPTRLGDADCAPGKLRRRISDSKTSLFCFDP